MKNKKLTLALGITTCYGDDSILDTIKSIRASKGVEKFKFIIVADRVPINPKLKKGMKSFGVKLIENKIEGSQPTKQKQILRMVNSDITIFTQDDVLFDKNTVSDVLNEFKKDPDLTMVSILNKPVKATNNFENIIEIGTNLANRFAKYWNKGDNYLSVIGRFMAFRTKHLKKFKISDKVATTDAYYYFENRRTGGKYKYLPDVPVLFKNPQNMIEHLRKSSRFQYSKNEMEHYFGNLDKEYKIPVGVVIRSLLGEFLKNPLKVFLYFVIFGYTRFLKLSSKKVMNAVWEVDTSTKKVLNNN